MSSIVRSKQIFFARGTFNGGSRSAAPQSHSTTASLSQTTPISSPAFQVTLSAPISVRSVSERNKVSVLEKTGFALEKTRATADQLNTPVNRNMNVVNPVFSSDCVESPFEQETFYDESNRYSRVTAKHREILLSFAFRSRKEISSMEAMGLALEVIDLSSSIDGENVKMMQSYACKQLNKASGIAFEKALEVVRIQLKSVRDMLRLICCYHCDPELHGKDLLLVTKQGQYGFIRGVDMRAVCCDSHLSRNFTMKGETTFAKLLLRADEDGIAQSFANVVNQFCGDEKFTQLNEMTSAMAYLFSESFRNIDALFLALYHAKSGIALHEVFEYCVRWSPKFGRVIIDDVSMEVMKIYETHGDGNGEDENDWRVGFNEQINELWIFLKDTYDINNESLPESFHVELVKHETTAETN
jgi:hypothetical protein